MTDVNGADAALADRIASRGREALVERLRTAYADAAASHADIVSLDEARIEALVQSAVDRADGLQWRRALAQVATEELGVSLAHALTHPAVREAQARLGAPSYEAGLAELVARPVPPPAPAPADQLELGTGDESHGDPVTEPIADAVAEPVTEPIPDAIAEPITDPVAEPITDPAPEPIPDPVAEPAPEPIEEEEEEEAPPVQPEMVIDEPEAHGATGELEAVEADDEIFELLPTPEPVEYEAANQEPVADQEPVAAPPAVEESPPEDDSLQVLAYHLGGVANLPTGRDGLDLRLSESGLDIFQRDGEIIGRLHWEEIDTLEVVELRGRLRRQARTLARIVVRTKHGDASFEVPGLSSDDLEARVGPLVSRYGGTR